MDGQPSRNVVAAVMRLSATVTMVLALASTGCIASRAPYRIHPIGQGRVVTPGAQIIAEDGSFQLTAGQPFVAPFEQGGNCLLDPTVDNYRQAIGAGARPVVIRLADGRLLFGLLSLCGAPAGARGAATRSYEIQIPNSYVEATAGGRVSVVFEGFTSSPIRAKAWTLWLAERSFRNEPADLNAKTVDRRVDAAIRPYKKMRTVGLVLLGVGAIGALYGLSSVQQENVAPAVIGLVIGGTLVITGATLAATPGSSTAVRRSLALDDRRGRERIIGSTRTRGLVFAFSGRF